MASVIAPGPHCSAEGRGLTEAGLPDPDWRTFCDTYPKFGFWAGNVENPELYWTCKIVYGTKWGHLHYGMAVCMLEAQRIAFTKAVKAGMPIRWAPDNLDL